MLSRFFNSESLEGLVWLYDIPRIENGHYDMKFLHVRLDQRHSGICHFGMG